MDIKNPFSEDIPRSDKGFIRLVGGQGRRVGGSDDGVLLGVDPSAPTAVGKINQFWWGVMPSLLGLRGLAPQQVD